MAHSFLKALVSVNRALTVINAFIFFGLLFQFGPTRFGKAKPVRIPLPVNVALLFGLVVVLILVFRAYGFWEPANVSPIFS